MSPFRPLVLGYHAASAAWPHALSLAPEQIERQVTKLLRRHFRPATAEEVVANPDAQLLHVTFDDAFASVADVLPALERLGVPATVFVSTAFADGEQPFRVPELEAQYVAYPDEFATLGWPELRALAERGVEIGSHTVSHPHLPRLSDGEIERELAESRRRVEEMLGQPCRFLAYPYGEEDARCRRAARAAGYRAAFAFGSFGSPAHELDGDPYALPRVGMFRGSGRLRDRLKTTFAVRRSAAILARLAGAAGHPAKIA